MCNNKILLILYVLHYTFYINPHSAKHFHLFICCEKFIFDNTKSDASTDFVLLVLFRNIYSCIKSECAKHFPLFIGCEKYLFDSTKSDDSTDFVDNISFSQYIYILGWVVNE
jgi:hypothetical protein